MTSHEFFSLPVIISLVTLFGMVGGFIANHYRSVIGQNQKIYDFQVATNERLKVIEVSATELKTRFNVFWAVIEKELPKILIRPTHKEMDELLEKVSERRANDEELEKLKHMMKEELDAGLAKEDAGRALAYVMMLARIEAMKARPPGVG